MAPSLISVDALVSLSKQLSPSDWVLELHAAEPGSETIGKLSIGRTEEESGDMWASSSGRNCRDDASFLGDFFMQARGSVESVLEGAFEELVESSVRSLDVELICTVCVLVGW